MAPAPAPAPATSSSSQSNPAISSNSSISPNPNSSSSNQTSQLDATSHPSLAAWQRLFSRHQPVSSSTNNTQQPRRQRSGNLLLTPTTSNTDTQSQIQVQKPRNSTLVKTEAEHEDAMRRLRRMILTEGIPDDKFATPSGTPHRPIIWKLLLSIRSLPVTPYLSLVSKGKSPAHDKIRNDTFRTLATDQGFKRRVKEEKLIRLLDAFAWKHWDEGDEPQDTPYDFSYVQGMNVLAAPFLYTLPSELEAFHCFSRFIEVCCPLYVQPTLPGVHRGLQLLDKCLELADPALYGYLRSKNLSAEIYAFPSVLTLCACTPPLEQVLQLWDFLLAFGVHLNILCVVSQLLLIRDELMHSPSPMRLLRNFPPLEAQPVIGITVTLVRDLPDSLYDELVRHTYDPSTATEFM